MAIFPVIMCGGSGTRLWPASRPSRPKQFIPLAGNRSLFQEAALRVVSLAKDGGRLIVVGGVSHRRWIVDQLEAIDIKAQILLEPEARDSAAAMAAAAAWTRTQDPSGVNVFVASDHHITDHDAFRRAVVEAASTALKGRIVTLGVKPTEPSAAYGYIRPAGKGLSVVEAFVEKPDTWTATQYLREGYLWNSGNFIVSSEVLGLELEKYAPAVAQAVELAVANIGDASVAVLGNAFKEAPKTSIDYAVMERTERASVLPVDFQWSDLGAWDTVAASGEGELGLHVFEDAEGCLARAPDGMLVAAVGVRNLAIIAERDAVLVCDLSRAQDIKKVVERIRETSPRHLDFTSSVVESLPDGGRRFIEWMRLRVLPLWAAVGQDAEGAFSELLAQEGRTVRANRRARVQSRQIQVFAEAGRLGWPGPWSSAVEKGAACLLREYVRDDGQVSALLAPNGSVLDNDAYVYDQAFMMFALAAVHRAGGAGAGVYEAQAVRVRELLTARAGSNGALTEAGSRPFQSNAHMHLLEACLAWEEAGGDDGWKRWSEQLVELAISTFIDEGRGCLYEFFSEDWSRAAGSDGRLVEPGHQFEWAWLLARFARKRSNAHVLGVARRLYAFGMKGVSERLDVAVDVIEDCGGQRGDRARLWPQTEWLKAALLLAELSEDGERQRLLSDAARAMRALWLYLAPDGVWRDKRLGDRTFVDEPAPASSLYHIMGALTQLVSSDRALGLGIAESRPLA